MNYIPLSVKTHYELLSSLIKIEDLMKFLCENNISSVGITDFNMFGTMEFVSLCNKYNIKPIIGVPFIVDELNMTLYAKNYKGYVNLLNLVSIRNTSVLTFDILKEKKDNVICVTKDYVNFDKYSELFDEVYASFSTDEEKMNALTVSKNIVYVKDIMYFNKEDKEYLVYLNMIRDSKTIDDFSEYDYDNDINTDISEEDALTTIDFASLINIEMPKVKFKMPEYSKDKVNLLNTLCNKGLNKRLNGEVSDKYIERLNNELKVINDMDFTDYFLIVYDFILYAKKNGIVVGPGRGSAAGSLVSYSLGITEIDPLKYNLIFERFLNKDRVTLPDIDIDIEYLRREELVNYVKEKYGKDKVANIITFGTLLPKQVIRDIGRVLKIDNIKIDNLCKLIKNEETFNEIEHNNEFINFINNDRDLIKLFDICKRLQGLKRHTSIHAAGIVISEEPLMNKVPLFLSSDTLLTGYTMEYLESIGLLKIDFLAIKNLSIIDSILKEVKNKENLNINLNKIPLNDRKTLEIFYNANTNGIFQFESEGMKSFLKSLKVKTFDDLVSAIALYRPGPRDNIDEFIKVREGKKKANYIVPLLESILKETNGIIIYQEQIIEILKSLGGFSYSEADNIRRAMSKKKEDIILNYKDAFIKGAIKNNIDEDKAREIYVLVLKFANYGFNKSHSVAYSLVAYQMAFLKAHFTSYFIKNLLNGVIGNSEKTNEYISEGKKLGLIFDNPNINVSTNLYFSLNNEVTLPLNIIKNVGKESITFILEERNKGIFLDFIDFVKRCYNQKVNKLVIESLIYAGCLDCLKLNKATMIENLDKIIEYATLSSEIGSELLLKPEIEIKGEFDENYLLQKEIQLYGFYIKNHPVIKYRSDDIILLSNINKYFDKSINIVGLVENIKEIKTKNNETMVFINISDETDKKTLIIFPNLYKEITINKGDIIKVNAKVEKRLSEYQLLANKIQKM